MAEKDVVVEEPVRWHPPPPPIQPPIEVIKAEQKAPLIAEESTRTSPETVTSGGGSACGWSTDSGAASDTAEPEASRGGWGRRYTRRELEEATDGLAAGNVLGEGGYGVVYRGVLRDSTAVAIKNLHNNRALALLREATRESADRRRALCTPRLLASLRRVLLIPRHTSARVDATAALVNLSLEPANKVRIVRAGAVPALVEVLRSGGSAPEAREHATGALFGLALNEENRAAIGVLGAVPPLLDLLTSPAHHPRARRDAGMAIYHPSLAAVNQSKVAHFPGARVASLSPTNYYPRLISD